MKKIKPIILLTAILLCIKFVSAQNNDWLRHPVISPDGKTIVFNYNGDLYKIPSTGGKAYQLTSNTAYDFNAVFSNDGKQIAFASDRHGNFDVFLLKIEGGIPKRLTHNSAGDTPTSFSPDDKKILFESNRLDAKNSLVYYRMPELYSVSVDGGLPEQVLSIPVANAKYLPNGNILFEEMPGGEDELRKHHKSSVTRDLWVYKTDGTFLQLTDFNGEDRNPAPINDDTFYYLTEETGSFNVFKTSISNTTMIDQISEFNDFPVRHLSVSKDGLLCYSFNGAIYTQREGKKPEKISINILSDITLPTEKILSVGSGVSEMVPSPNGKEVVFIFRGEVFVTAIESGLTRQITHTPEQERSIDISSDGRSIVYAGERNNSWNLYTTSLVKENEKYFLSATELKEEVLLENEFETFQPAFSPDGKEVAFLQERIELKVIDVKTKKVRTIHDGTYNYSYADGDQTFTWSPDGKWFLVEFYPPQKWTSEIGLISADGKGEIKNLSKSGFYDGSPSWLSKDLIIWLSNKDGMKSQANTGSSTVDIYGLFLTKEAYDEFQLSEVERELLPEDEDEKEKKEKDDDKKDDKKEDKKIEPIKINFTGLTDRKEKFTEFTARITDALVTPDNKNILFIAKTGKTFKLMKYDLIKKETKSLTTLGKRGASMRLDKEGKNVFVLSRGKISKVGIADGKKKSVAISGEMKLDEAAERVYLFDHVARQVKKKFLDPDLHGANWDMQSKNYRQFISGLNNNYDFQQILSELLGELNASHTGARNYPSKPKSDATATFGAFYKNDYDGNGLMIDEIIKGSPLINADGKIKPGIVIEKIDGKLIKKGMNYYSLLNRKAGKNLILTLLDPENDKRWIETIKPINKGAENELRYQRWIKQNRELVHKYSDNRIGYMHVKSMGDGSFREFIDKVLGEEVNKEALIVDTRNNGGGDLVDDLTTFLSGMQYMKFKWKDKIVGYESQYRWTKPSIMLACEANYSDAHCTPVAYKDQGIGKIVGMPVPGTCSFVWWERLQNGMVFGIPNMAVLDIEGDVLENKQLEPDFKVKNDFNKIVNGEDQQIKKAVDELLKELN